MRARSRAALPTTPARRAGEWLNPALSPAAVQVAERCYGEGSCAGVVAWRVGVEATLTPAAAPATTPALAFTLTAGAATATLTRLGGGVTQAGSATVWGRTGNAFTTTAGSQLSSAPSSATGWTQLYTGAWLTSGDVALTVSLTVPAGGTATLVVVSASPAALSCVHTLGDASALLLNDAALSVSQGGAMTAAGSLASPASACAWAGLALTYSLPSACAPPAPAPAPDIVTSTPNTLVGSLDDLLRALANANVTSIEVMSHIALNGTELSAALPASGKRTLLIAGTNACRTADPSTPLCSLDAGGASRILRVVPGLRLRVGYLLLANGRVNDTDAAASGGCVLADCAGCSLYLDAAVLRNCSAPRGRGGGGAVFGGGSLTAADTSF
jgi:hypothetical protein